MLFQSFVNKSAEFLRGSDFFDVLVRGVPCGKELPEPSWRDFRGFLYCVQYETLKKNTRETPKNRAQGSNNQLHPAGLSCEQPFHCDCNTTAWHNAVTGMKHFGSADGADFLGPTIWQRSIISRPYLPVSTTHKRSSLHRHGDLLHTKKQNVSSYSVLLQRFHIKDFV